MLLGHVLPLRAEHRHMTHTEPMIPKMQVLRKSQSSQIVSKSRSCLLSAPHTLHRFRLSREPKPLSVRPRVGTSKLLLPFASPASAASAAAFSWAIRSASKAASSASGESGIVSKLEMLGLLDLADVGVEGTEEGGYAPEYP